MTATEPRPSFEGFHLPFDEKRPVVVCGAPGSGTTDLAAHLVNDEPAGRPVVVVTATPDLPPLAGLDATHVHPDQHETDADFFRAAGFAVRAAIDTSALLLVDHLDILTGPYLEPMTEQDDFVETLDVALRTLRTRGARVVLAAATAPAKGLLASTGVRILLGEPDPTTWTALFGPEHTPVPAAPMTGTYGLFGALFPLNRSDEPPAVNHDDTADQPAA